MHACSTGHTSCIMSYSKSTCPFHKASSYIPHAFHKTCGISNKIYFWQLKKATQLTFSLWKAINIVSNSAVIPLAIFRWKVKTFFLDVPLRRRVACLSEPLYKHAAREKLCAPAAPVREHLFRAHCCHSVIHPSWRSASLNGRVLQPQCTSIYRNEWYLHSNMCTSSH